MSRAETTSAPSGPVRRLPRWVTRLRLGTRLFLTTIWVMLLRDISPGNVVSGFVLAGFVMAVFPMPAMTFALRLRPWSFVVLLVRFLADVVKASLEVVYKSVTPWSHPVGRFTSVRLHSTHDLPRTLTAELTSLVPGSLVVDLDRDTGTLTLHLFDAPTEQSVRNAVARVHAQERRLTRALFAEEVG